ncbi:hypothetical protein BIY27_12135 [Gibbsiella quercinecans]|uniref:hypothetical protein n=1 Tax=Gibbsiella quercinecans TaxID=929813 RepID=UPI000F14793E|nr:hypothetical protein [Gibbsiella quercinecans]RLM11782.1 hypothetical protein BIY27_12135 [Gibbsiella quercinecans]
MSAVTIIGVLYLVYIAGGLINLQIKKKEAEDKIVAAFHFLIGSQVACSAVFLLVGYLFIYSASLSFSEWELARQVLYSSLFYTGVGFFGVIALHILSYRHQKR